MAKSSATPLNVQVSGKQMETGEALRTRITDDLNAGVGKYFDKGGEADVVVAKDRFGVVVDIVVRLAMGQQLASSGQGGDAHSAFSEFADKAILQELVSGFESHLHIKALWKQARWEAR